MVIITKYNKTEKVLKFTVVKGKMDIISEYTEK